VAYDSVLILRVKNARWGEVLQIFCMFAHVPWRFVVSAAPAFSSEDWICTHKKMLWSSSIYNISKVFMRPHWYMILGNWAGCTWKFINISNRYRTSILSYSAAKPSTRAMGCTAHLHAGFVDRVDALLGVWSCSPLVPCLARTESSVVSYGHTYYMGSEDEYDFTVPVQRWLYRMWADYQPTPW
jgi:hypothetical protein